MNWLCLAKSDEYYPGDRLVGLRILCICVLVIGVTLQRWCLGGGGETIGTMITQVSGKWNKRKEENDTKTRIKEQASVVY